MQIIYGIRGLKADAVIYLCTNVPFIALFPVYLPIFMLVL